jgi:hypothetical protein
MKTKFALFIIFNLCIFGFSFSQNTGGNGDPDSLNVTVNDTTQNLQVNGSIVVDSSLTVKDSVIMEDNLHVYEKLRLEQDAHLRKDVYIGNTLKVEGESYFNGDAFFNEKVFLNGLDTLDSLAFAESSDSMSVTNKPSLLFVDENGALRKGDDDILKSIIYTGKFCTEIIGADGLPILVTNPPNPTWENGPNKLFLAECPSLARVGIGTSNPRVKLDVIGRAAVTHLAVGIADPVQQTARFHLKAPLSTSNESTLFLIENNERKLMQLNNDGLLYAREIKVNLETTWPDYVFEHDYNLMSLDELKTYIDANGHLPNIPSASEVERKGINVAETDKMLLEKVEELTLYILQMKEQMKLQEEKIEELVKLIPAK